MSLLFCETSRFLRAQFEDRTRVGRAKKCSREERNGSVRYVTSRQLSAWLLSARLPLTDVSGVSLLTHGMAEKKRPCTLWAPVGFPCFGPLLAVVSSHLRGVYTYRTSAQKTNQNVDSIRVRLLFTLGLNCIRSSNKLEKKWCCWGT